MAALSKETRKQMAHVLAGVVIMIKGVDKIDHHHPATGWTLIVIGLGVFSLTLLHHRLARHIKSFDGLVFFIEAIVLGIVSAMYFQDGKKALPFAYLIASIAYLFAAYRMYQRDQKTVPHH
ncbi:hypothetical protein [Spirosoma gilvum]